MFGLCLIYGHGVKKDPEQAVSWFRKSAEMGNADASSSLAVCYGEGVGVEKDLKKAAYWEQKAKEQEEDEDL